MNDLTREEAEGVVGRSLETRLGPLLSLVQRLDSLFDRVFEAVADSPRSGAATEVGLLLANRVANDVRCCAILSRQGYGIQGLTLASSLYEVVGALAYVGYDDERATAWATHRDTRHTYPRRVSDGFAAIARIANLPDEDIAGNLADGYEYVCMAKHANPTTALLHGLQPDPAEELAFAVGPDGQFLGASASARTLWYAASLGALAVYVTLGHCSADDTRGRLLREAAAADHQRLQLEPWYLTVIQRTSNETTWDVMQAEALTAVTESLRRGRRDH